MKYVFNKTLKKVSDFYGIEQEELFEKTKKQLIADSRPLVYYICLQSPNFKVSYIQKYMQEKGYHADHAEIIYGKKKWVEWMKEHHPDSQNKLAELTYQCIN